MAYTAEIIDKDLDLKGQRLNVRVEFSNGSTTVEKILPFAQNASFDEIKWKLKLIAEEMDDAETKSATVSTGSVDLTKATSPNDEAKLTWYQDLSKLEDMQKLVNLGVVADSATEYTTLKTKVTNNYKAEYLGL